MALTELHEVCGHAWIALPIIALEQGGIAGRARIAAAVYGFALVANDTRPWWPVRVKT